MDDEVLSWRGAVRIADTLHRPGGSATRFVQSLLAHLRRAGLTSLPEPLGVDEHGREVYRWVAGTAGAVPVASELATDRALIDLGRLIRRVHDTSATFRAEPGSWNQLLADPSGSEVICHNDLSISNTVYRGGRPIAFVDWEFAARGSRLWDLAYAS